MEISLPEIIDRISIAKLKVERVGEPQCIEELEAYEKELQRFKDKGVVINTQQIDDLYRVNGKLWDLEWDVREIANAEDPWKEAEKIGLKELGKRAFKVWEANKQRAILKNQIAEETGEGFKEVKIDHAASENVT